MATDSARQPVNQPLLLEVDAARPRPGARVDRRVTACAWTQRCAAFEDVCTPVWLYSCEERRNLWGNPAALELYARTLEAFTDADVYAEASDSAEFERVNQALREQVELGGKCKVLRTGPGWRCLPGCAQEVALLGMGLTRFMFKPFTADQAGVEGAPRPVCLVQLEMRAVEEMEANVARLTVMHARIPIFEFLFDEAGDFLFANQRALEYYTERLGINFCLKDLFGMGIYEGGAAEAQRQYEAALDAVFGECRTHRAQQQIARRKDPNQKKWVEFEMWPITDPVTGRPAVLVSQDNITRNKTLELNLRQEADALHADNERLQAELVSALDQVNGGGGRPDAVDTATPIDKTLALLEGLAAGRVPSAAEVEGLRAMLTSADNLHAPAKLKEQLLAEGAFERDVGLNLLQLLGGSNTVRSSEAAGGDTSGTLMRYDSQALDGPTDLSRLTSMQASVARSAAATSGRRMGGQLSRLMSVGFAAPDLPPPDKEVVPRSLVPEVESVLATVETWTFDPFKLTEVTQNHPLSTLGYWIMKRTDLVTLFGFDEAKLARFLRRIEEGYPANPYHNRTHAADVLQSMHMLITHGGLYANRLCQVSAYTAALVHDFEHGGLNNDFLVRANDLLALRYNDRSPLENHHLAGSFSVMRHPECDFLGDLPPEARDIFRKLVIDLVLATDMKQHFNITSQFVTKLVQSQTRSSLEGGEADSPTTGVRRFVRSASTGSGTETSSVTSKDLEEGHLSLMFQMALKCADVGHLAAPWEVHKRWVGLLEEEFFRQGDQEAAMGTPVSPLMDRAKPGITKSQVGFFEVVVLPLFRQFVQVFPRSQPMLDQVEGNYANWVAVNNGTAPA